MKINRILIATAAVAALLPLSSCFTGIESTPRIEAPRDAGAPRGDDRRADSEFLADIVPEPFGTWKPGKRFAVVDGRFALLLGASAPEGVDLGGTTVSWVGSRNVTTVTGATATELTFVGIGGDTLIYRAPSERVGTIPFLVDLDLVAEVERRLNGRKVWTMTSVWRDAADAPVNGRKFVAVTVDSVSPGNAECQLQLHFIASDDLTPGDGRFFFDAGPAGGTRTVRRFASLMSLSDPRQRYPGIDDGVWACIVRGDVAPGMTRDQVRLAVGSPRDVDRRTGNGSSGVVTERWIYDTGRIVTFEDGIVVDRRR